MSLLDIFAHNSELILPQRAPLAGVGSQMISSFFLGGNMLPGGELQIDARGKKIKFWNFWECPLYEMWKYAFNMHMLKLEMVYKHDESI